jgi:hypothetical protein
VTILSSKEGSAKEGSAKEGSAKEGSAKEGSAGHMPKGISENATLFLATWTVAFQRD